MSRSMARSVKCEWASPVPLPEAEPKDMNCSPSDSHGGLQCFDCHTCTVGHMSCIHKCVETYIHTHKHSHTQGKDLRNISIKKTTDQINK